MKKTLAIVLCVLMLFSLVACAGGTKDAGPTSTVNLDTELTTGGTDEAVDLTFLGWGTDAQQAVQQRAIDRFTANYPNCTVDFVLGDSTSWGTYITTWSNLVTSGNAPDIINIAVEGSSLAVKKGLVLPLTSVVEQFGLDVTKYCASSIDPWTFDGVLYGIPNGLQTSGMAINLNVFDDAGVAYPQAGWTFDEFYDIAESLTTDTIYGYGFLDHIWHISPWVFSNGGYWLDENGLPAVNEAKIVEGLTFVNSMIEAKICPDPISSDTMTMFSNNELAMNNVGKFSLATYSQGAVGTNWDYIEVPIGPSNTTGKSITVNGGSAMLLGSSVTDQDLFYAVQLLIELGDNAFLEDWILNGSEIPPVESLVTPEVMGTYPTEEFCVKFWDVVNTSICIPCPVYYYELNDTVGRYMDLIWSGEMEVQAAMDAANAELLQTIQDGYSEYFPDL